MNTNCASDYQVIFLSTTKGEEKVGKDLTFCVQAVVIKGDDQKESMGITSSKKIAEFLGRNSPPMGVVEIIFDKVTAIEADAEHGWRKLVHGKGADENEIKFSQSPTDPKEEKAIVVLME